MSVCFTGSSVTPVKHNTGTLRGVPSLLVTGPHLTNPGVPANGYTFLYLFVHLHHLLTLTDNHPFHCCSHSIQPTSWQVMDGQHKHNTRSKCSHGCWSICTISCTQTNGSCHTTEWQNMLTSIIDRLGLHKYAKIQFKYFTCVQVNFLYKYQSNSSDTQTPNRLYCRPDNIQFLTLHHQVFHINTICSCS
jgi:hypothetical protein